MKKTKLLMPILATAGLGCAIAPLTVMTGCNRNKTIDLNDMVFENSYYTTGLIKFEKNAIYKTQIQYSANKFSKTTVELKHTDKERSATYMGFADNSLKVKISYSDGSTAEPSCEPTGYNSYTFNNFRYAIASTIEITWKSNADSDTDLQMIVSA